MNGTEISMQMILHAGNATTCAYKAIAAAKKADFTEAKHQMEEAEKEEKLAHVDQTKLLQGFAQGVESDCNILMTHSMDHLTMATLNMKIAYEVIDLYQYLYSLKKGGEE